MRRRRCFCLTAATLALVTTAAAQAAPPQESTTKTSAQQSSAEHEGLPFSGFDVALLAAGGGPLLLLGMSLRRKRPKTAVKPAKEETLTLA